MYRFLFLIIAVIPLFGCTDATPMELTEEHEPYIGVWQQRIEEETESSLKVDSMLLAIYPDATAVYRKCEVDNSWSEHSKRTFRISTDFSEAVVTDISEESITVAQDVGWIAFDSELELDRDPYQEGQRWYMDIEGKTLAKLSESEVQTMIDWACPDTDDDEESF